MERDEVLALDPDLRDLVATRGWAQLTAMVANIKAELVQSLAYTAEEKDIPFLRGQLIALDTLVGLPAKVMASADAFRNEIDETEKFRRNSRAKFGMPLNGEVSQ